MKHIGFLRFLAGDMARFQEASRRLPYSLAYAFAAAADIIDMRISPIYDISTFTRIQAKGKALEHHEGFFRHSPGHTYSYIFDHYYRYIRYFARFFRRYYTARRQPFLGLRLAHSRHSRLRFLDCLLS